MGAYQRGAKMREGHLRGARPRMANLRDTFEMRDMLCEKRHVFTSRGVQK